jgi:hypothetical protein
MARERKQTILLKQKKERFLRAVKKHGLMKLAAEDCNVSVRAVYHWLQVDKDFADELEKIDLELVERVEGALVENALNGNVVAQMFLLRKRDRWKGYGDLMQTPSVAEIPIKLVSSEAHEEAE